MQEEPSDTKMTPGASDSSRGEKRTETQKATSVKKRVTTNSSTEKRTTTFADEPVKRRLTGKTDTKSDDVLMPLGTEDSDLLNTVNTLLNDETGEEKNPRSDDAEKAKILTILDDPKEVKKRRQKELNSQKEMGVMRAVKRSEAAGKRVIQT